MRIVRYLLIFTALVLILGVGSFFVVREALLYWGTQSLVESLRSLKESATSGLFEIECARKTGGTGFEVTSDPVTVQLRFLSSEEYVLEAVCAGFPQSPILIKQQTLPPFITKVPGTSGFIWEELHQSGVELAVFSQLEKQLSDISKFDLGFISKSRGIMVDDRVIVTRASVQPDLSAGPETSCEGYGYTCCNETAEMGAGSQITGLPSCPERCFAACVARPVVLSFNSNPFFDVKTRTVSIGSGETVEFRYVGSSTSNGLQAVVDFGDGKQGMAEGTQGSIVHNYTCNQAACAYPARIILRDAWGVESIDTPVSKITINVTGK